LHEDRQATTQRIDFLGLYSSIIAWFIFVLSSAYCSRSFISRGVTSFIFAIER